MRLIPSSLSLSPILRANVHVLFRERRAVTFSAVLTMIMRLMIPSFLAWVRRRPLEWLLPLRLLSKRIEAA
jgi:hypothetical protein